MVPHRGARGRAISVYSTTWPSMCSGAQRYSTDRKAAHDELFHRCRGLLLDYSGMEGASSRFIIESSGLWKQEV